MSHIEETSALGTRRLRRLVEKPTLADWDDDEPLSLAEAFELDITGGALSPKGLRTAVRKGEVAFSEVAGKIWITKQAVREAFLPRPMKRLHQSAPVSNEDEAMPAEAKVPTVSLAINKIAAARSAEKARRRLARPS
jgi:hypothetical protein